MAMEKIKQGAGRKSKRWLPFRKAKAIIKDVFENPLSTSTISIIPKTTEIHKIDLESIVTQLRHFRRMPIWTTSLSKEMAKKLAEKNEISFEKLASLIESSSEYGTQVLSELFDEV